MLISKLKWLWMTQRPNLAMFKHTKKNTIKTCFIKKNTVMSNRCQHLTPENSNLLHCIKDFWNSTQTVSKERTQRKCGQAGSTSEKLKEWNYLSLYNQHRNLYGARQCWTFKVPAGAAKSRRLMGQPATQNLTVGIIP